MYTGFGMGKPEGKRPLGKPIRTWEDNIKMYLREVGCEERHDVNTLEYALSWPRLEVENFRKI